MLIKPPIADVASLCQKCLLEFRSGLCARDLIFIKLTLCTFEHGHAEPGLDLLVSVKINPNATAYKNIVCAKIKLFAFSSMVTIQGRQIFDVMGLSCTVFTHIRHKAWFNL